MHRLELRRQIRGLVETALASALLRGEVSEGDTVLFTYDAEGDRVRWKKRTPVGAAAGRAERDDRKGRLAAEKADRPAEESREPLGPET